MCGEDGSNIEERENILKLNNDKRMINSKQIS